MPSYIKLASEDVDAYYDAQDFIVGFEIRGICNEIGDSFNLELDYGSKRGKDISVPSQRQKSHQLKSENMTNFDLHLSPNQLNSLRDCSSKKDISDLVNEIVVKFIKAH